MPATVTGLNILSAISAGLPRLSPPRPVYAIVDSESFEPLTVPDSWGEFTPRFESTASDYPQEFGAFAVYNKVRRPVGVTVTLIKTGSDTARFTWFAAIQQAEQQDPTRLYTLISPQAVYPDFTLLNMSYETRPDRGSNMLILTMQFMQVPQIPSSEDTYTDPQEAKSEPVDDVGQVYTEDASTAQTALIDAHDFTLQ